MAANRFKQSGGTRLIESIERAERASLEAVRHFLDTVDGVFPHLGADDGPRRKIIDSAFKMTEQLVATSTEAAQHARDITQKVLTDSHRKSTSKAAGKKASARQSAAKRAPTRKAPARKAGAKQATPKRASARKTTATRSSARKAPARKATARRRQIPT